jgi:putative polymerase
MGEIVLARRLPWIASTLVVAAATFNMGLCFLNTRGLPISAAHVIATEVVIIGLAASLSYRVLTPQISVFAAIILAYLCTLWLIHSAVNPKVVRDVLIPLVFLLCGSAQAEPRDADRLVYILILIVFAFAIVEWFWFDRFLNVFDITSYYLAKGRADASEVWMEVNVAMNGIRVEGEGRTLFPVLGLHRVSSVFLEPLSAEYFSVIAFAWLLVRFRAAPLKNLIFMALVATVIILADGRLAAIACLLLIIARMLPLLPPTGLWLLPFVSIAGAMIYATILPGQEVDQSFAGRLVGSGRLIAGFGLNEWFGISHSLAQSTLDNLDSGYAYLIYAVGLPGLVLLWTAFSFARDQTVDGARFRTLLALYLSLALCVSEGVFSIKTAALAWFLLGATQNRDGVLRVAHSVSRLQVSPASS